MIKDNEPVIIRIPSETPLYVLRISSITGIVKTTPIRKEAQQYLYKSPPYNLAIDNLKEAPLTANHGVITEKLKQDD